MKYAWFWIDENGFGWTDRKLYNSHDEAKEGCNTYIRRNYPEFPARWEKQGDLDEYEEVPESDDHPTSHLYILKYEGV